MNAQSFLVCRRCGSALSFAEAETASGRAGYMAISCVPCAGARDAARRNVRRLASAQRRRYDARHGVRS